MKFIPKSSSRSVFRGEDGEEIILSRGDDGSATLLLRISDQDECGAELNVTELAVLRDVLLKFSPVDGSRPSYTERTDIRCKFESEDGVNFSVRYSNRGEPYREGLTFDLVHLEHRLDMGVFLTEYEVREMRAAVLVICPETVPELG